VRVNRVVLPCKLTASVWTNRADALRPATGKWFERRVIRHERLYQCRRIPDLRIAIIPGWIYLDLEFMRHIPSVPAIVHALAPAIAPAIAAAMLAIASPAASAQGDPERGKVIAYTCTGCHGIPFYKNVYPTYTVPKLGGQNQEYLISALEAYRSGTRRHPTMQAQASTLSDQDILDVTAFFVSIGEGES